MFYAVRSAFAILTSVALLALAGCATAPPPTRMVVVDAEPLPFDTALLPPNTVPGDCLVRTPRGWLRAACPYRLAGRDAEGYLVWPGKTPR